MASAVLAAASLIVLVPTFNALSSSGITPAEPPFRLDDPPPFTPPENPPPVNPDDGSGEGETEVPFQPPCDRTKRYTIFEEAARGGLLSPASVRYSGERFERHEWRPETTIAVVWGFEMRDFSGSFEVTIERDGERVAHEQRTEQGNVLGSGSNEEYRSPEPIPRESLDDEWTFDWSVRNGQGAVGIGIYGLEPDCETPEERGDA